MQSHEPCCSRLNFSICNLRKRKPWTATHWATLALFNLQFERVQAMNRDSLGRISGQSSRARNDKGRLLDEAFLVTEELDPFQSGPVTRTANLLDLLHGDDKTVTLGLGSFVQRCSHFDRHQLLDLTSDVRCRLHILEAALTMDTPQWTSWTANKAPTSRWT